MNIDIKNLSKEQIEDLKKQLAEYKEEQPIEWTRDGIYRGDNDYQKHYNICSDFRIAIGVLSATTGLSFQTEKQAEKFRDKLQALKTIKKWHALNDNFEPDWNDEYEEKYYIGCIKKSKGLYFSRTYTCNYIPFLPYYSSSEKAEKAMKELEKEYKIIFDVI